MGRRPNHFPPTPSVFTRRYKLLENVTDVTDVRGPLSPRRYTFWDTESIFTHNTGTRHTKYDRDPGTVHYKYCTPIVLVHTC